MTIGQTFRHSFYGIGAPFSAAVAGLLLLVTGCRDAGAPADRVDAVIGERGLMPGTFVKPRAITIDPAGNLAVVDFQALVQWLGPDGAPIHHWLTPTHAFGRPSGLGLDRQGNLLVADSHYHRILVYDRQGSLLKQFGGDEGDHPLVGRFGYVGDVEADSLGNIYIAESQQAERITKISPTGEVLAEWGGLGSRPGEFQRVRAMAFNRADRLYVADACNHRIQVFDSAGRFLFLFGEPGTDLGSMMYPYDVAISDTGDVYVCEYGNSRVQKFRADGSPVATWGRPGRGVGELWNPWALDVDSQGRVYVVDSNNHRIQRVTF